MDSTTPAVKPKGGKGPAGGGKNSQEVKTGNLQVIIGEGERFWNDKIVSSVEGTQTYFLQDPAITSNYPTLIERVDYETINTAYVNDLEDYSLGTPFTNQNTGQYTINVTKNNVPNLNAFSQRDDVISFLTSSVSGAWTIPSNDIGSLQSITVGFRLDAFVRTPSTCFNRVSIQPVLIQNGVKHFFGERSSSPFWHTALGQGQHIGQTFTLTQTRNNILSVVRAGNLTTQTHFSTGLTPLDFSEGAPPIEVGISFQPSTSGTSYNNGTVDMVLSDIQISYVADARAGGELELLKVYMNDEIWYNAETTNQAQLQQNLINQQYFTFYDGSLSQSQDPDLVALRGADKVPGLQGYSHVVFHDLPLDSWNNNYPTPKFLVQSSLDAEPKTIIRDLLYRAGGRYASPLLEGKDYAFALEDSGAETVIPANYPGVEIDGYVAKFDSSDIKNILAEVFQIFRLSLVSSPTTSIDSGNAGGFTVGTPPMYKVMPINHNKTINVEADVLGMQEADDGGLPWSAELQGQASDDIPGQVEVQFHNNNKGGERESLVIDRTTFQLGGVYNFNPSYYTDRKIGTANAIARHLISQGLTRARQLKVYQHPNQHTGLINEVSWEGEVVIRPQKVTLGADGSIELTGVSIDNSVEAEGFVPDPINDLQDPSNIAVSLEVIWWEGQSFLAPATGNLRTLYAWMAPTAGSTISSAASILISFDGGATLTTTNINSQIANAQQITINSMVPEDNSGDALYTGIDQEGIITVTVPNGIELNSVDLDFVIEGTKNVLLIPTVGLVGFQTATLVAANQYELTNLFWNLGQSLIDEGWRGTLSPIPSTAWLLLGPPYEVELTTGVVKNSDVTMVAATSSVNSPPYTKEYRALNSSPRHVTNVDVVLDEINEDITINWLPYIDQLTQLIPPLFAAPVVSGDTYTLIIREGATLRRTVTGITDRFYVYVEADQTSDGVGNREALTFEIIQEGDVDTLDVSVRYNSLGEVASVPTPPY